MILPDYRDFSVERDYNSEYSSINEDLSKKRMLVETENKILKGGFFLSTEFLKSSIRELDGAEIKMLIAISILSMEKFVDNIVYLSKAEKKIVAAITGNTLNTISRGVSALSRKGFLVKLGGKREALYAINPLFIRRSTDRDLAVQRINNQMDLK
jgi:hypothetical protein